MKIINYVCLTIISIFLTKIQAKSDIQSQFVASKNCQLFYKIEEKSHLIFQECIFSNTNSSDWRICSQKCCSNKYSADLNDLSFQKCLRQSLVDITPYEVYLVVVFIGFIIIGAISLGVLLKRYFNRKFDEERLKVNQTLNTFDGDKIITDVIEYNWIELKSQTAQNSNDQGERVSQYFEDQCSICLIKQNDLILDCKHSFHTECLGIWTRKKRQCPLCRQNIKTLYIKCSSCSQKYLFLKIDQFKHYQANNSICTKCVLKTNELQNYCQPLKEQKGQNQIKI